MSEFGAPQPEEPVIVPAAPIDRETALQAARTWARWTPQQIQTVEEGRGDNCPLVQLLARHRLASLAEAADAVLAEDQG